MEEENTYCRNCDDYTKEYDKDKQEWICECENDIAICLECKKEFHQDRDIQLCDECVSKFDLDTLWELHDKDKLDVLDFNENELMRERFRIRNWDKPLWKDDKLLKEVRK
jgi:hypothetical protein